MFEKELVGIDIGDKTIKFVLSKHSKKIKTLLDYYVCDIPESEEAYEKVIFTTISDALKLKKWTGKKINILISSKEIIQRGLKIPEIPKNELDAVVDREVKKLFGDISGKRVGYKIMGKETVDERSFYSLFFVLVPNIVLSKISEVSTKLNNIDFKLFAYDRIYQKVLEEKINSMVIDIGHLDTVLMIYKGKNLDIYREINSGGAEITNAIAHILQINFEEAENLKRKYGYISKEEAAALLEEEPRANQLNFSYQFVMDKILRKIKMSIDYFKTQNRGEEIAKVYLCGGGATLKGFDSFIKDEFANVDIVIYDGLDNFEIKKNIENFKTDALKLMGAMGTALMEHKIVEVGGKKKAQTSMKMINKIAAGAALLPFAASFGYEKYRETQYEANIKKYTMLNAEIQELVTSYDKMDADINRISADEINIDQKLSERSKFADVLFTLSDITLDNLFFDEINYDREREEILLKGFGVSSDGFPEISVNNFLHKLEEKYREVYLLGTKKSENKQVTSFEMMFKYRDPGGEKVEAK